MNVVFVVFFLINICVIKGQGEQCRSPNNQIGVCVTLPQCPSLIKLYGSNPGNKQIYAYVLGTQRSCGTRSIGRDPIVCCTQPASVRPTRPPPPPPTTTTTTTIAPTTDIGRTAKSSCSGPDTRIGICKSIKNCPEILSEFMIKSSDPEFVSYIRSSNAICEYIQPNVCCPYEDSNNVDSVTRSANTGTRLPTIDEGCGFSNVSHTRVVGGVPAVVGSWPWMALVGYEDADGIDFKCGGSLITSRHVLTAAHCLISTLRTVRLGEHDLSSDTETEIIDIAVVKVVKHPKYSKKDGLNDLAILFLETGVEFTLKIRPICLPTNAPERTKNYVGYQPFVTGWGKTQEGGKSANILQELQIPILENDICKDRYQAIGKLISEEQFGDAVLCAGILTGGKDSCQGDSGGPLVVASIINGQPIHFQIGVVSYGIGCARADVPGVYTKIQHFIDWIEQQISEPV